VVRPQDDEIYFNLDVLYDASQTISSPTYVKIPFSNQNGFPITATIRLMCTSTHMSNKTTCENTRTDATSTYCADPWPGAASYIEPEWIPCGCDKFVSVTVTFSTDMDVPVTCSGSNITAYMKAYEEYYATVTLLFASEIVSYGVMIDAEAGTQRNRALVQVWGVCGGVCVCLCMCVCHAHAHSICARACKDSMCVCVCVCMYVYMYVCMYVCILKIQCVCVCVCMFVVYMCLCIQRIRCYD
jgi:hypothetical protein